MFLGAPDNPNATYRREFNQLPSLVHPTPKEKRAASAAVDRVAQVLKRQLPKPNRVRFRVPQIDGARHSSGWVFGVIQVLHQPLPSKSGCVHLCKEGERASTRVCLAAADVDQALKQHLPKIPS